MAWSLTGLQLCTEPFIPCLHGFLATRFAEYCYIQALIVVASEKGQLACKDL